MNALLFRRFLSPGVVVALLASAFLGAGGCRGTDELVQSIGARVFVVGVDDDTLVQLDVAGLRVRSVPDGGSNLVSFALALDEGDHEGTVTVFDVERRGGESEQDGDEDERDVGNEGEDAFGPGELRPERCGPFSLTVAAGGEPTALAIVADDLPDCGAGQDPDESADPDDDPDDDPDVDRDEDLDENQDPDDRDADGGPDPSDGSGGDGADGSPPEEPDAPEDPGQPDDGDGDDQEPGDAGEGEGEG